MAAIAKKGPADIMMQQVRYPPAGHPMYTGKGIARTGKPPYLKKMMAAMESVAGGVSYAILARDSAEATRERQTKDYLAIGYHNIPQVVHDGLAPSAAYELLRGSDFVRDDMLANGQLNVPIACKLYITASFDRASNKDISDVPDAEYSSRVIRHIQDVVARVFGGMVIIADILVSSTCTDDKFSHTYIFDLRSTVDETHNAPVLFATVQHLRVFIEDHVLDSRFFPPNLMVSTPGRVGHDVVISSTYYANQIVQLLDCTTIGAPHVARRVVPTTSTVLSAADLAGASSEIYAAIERADWQALARTAFYRSLITYQPPETAVVIMSFTGMITYYGLTVFGAPPSALLPAPTSVEVTAFAPFAATAPTPAPVPQPKPKAQAQAKPKSKPVPASAPVRESASVTITTLAPVSATASTPVPVPKPKVQAKPKPAPASTPAPAPVRETTPVTAREPTPAPAPAAESDSDESASSRGRLVFPAPAGSWLDVLDKRVEAYTKTTDIVAAALVAHIKKTVDPLVLDFVPEGALPDSMTMHLGYQSQIEGGSKCCVHAPPGSTDCTTVWFADWLMGYFWQECENDACHLAQQQWRTQLHIYGVNSTRIGHIHKIPDAIVAFYKYLLENQSKDDPAELTAYQEKFAKRSRSVADLDEDGGGSDGDTPDQKRPRHE